MAPRYELAVGLTRGHKTIKNKQAPRPAEKKGVSFVFVVIVNNLIHFVCCMLINEVAN
jgi:hypothetical protein